MVVGRPRKSLLVGNVATPRQREDAFRMGRVLELRLMELNQKEIAKELGVPPFRVSDDLRLIGQIDHGGLVSRELERIDREMHARGGRKGR